MPGYATWKQLYQEEYFQMKEEGFELNRPACTGELAGTASATGETAKYGTHCGK